VLFQVSSLGFDRVPEFPKGGQGISGVLDQFLLCDGGFPLEYRRLPLRISISRRSGDPG